MPRNADLQLAPADLDDPRVVALVVAHQTRAIAETARGSAHALGVDGLRAADVSVWAAWLGDAPVAVGALRRLPDRSGELKSMYTIESARGRGVASAVLAHIEDAARAAGIATLFLETGSWPYFAPARAFYARHGYVVCAPFGDYADDPNSVFMRRKLPPDA